MKHNIIKYLILGLILNLPLLVLASDFIHPGTLHSQADLDRMKEKVDQQLEPWYSTWQKVQASPYATLTWTPNPLERICRGCPSGTSDNYIGMARDIACAYGCALRWHITGNQDYADKAVAVINAWGSTLKEIYGDTNAGLARGAYGYEWACVGDMMYHYDGWQADDKNTFKKMLVDVFLPGNLDFLERHNGTQDSHYRTNWDGFAMSAVMAIGIFTDSVALFDHIVDYYKNGAGNGNINHAVVHVHENGLGQWEESGRDQAHTANGIALLGYVCQMAWNQDVDLYAYGDNKLSKGMEYAAKYNLYNYVPYKSHSFWISHKIEWPVYTNTEHVVSPAVRGHLGPHWEVGYNHYVSVKGLDLPYSTRMATSLRPIGGAGYWGGTSGGFDHLGFGSLTYAIDEDGKMAQTITFDNVPELKQGEMYAPVAKASSGKQVCFSSSNTDVVDIIDNKIYARKAGTATITAWCNGDTTYAKATNLSKEIVVNEADVLAFSGKYTITTDGWSMVEGPQSAGASVSLNYNRYRYNSVRVNQWWNINPIPQHWYIRRVNGNDFKIINVAYNTALSVLAESTIDNSRVVLRAYKGSADQLWTIASEGGFYSFTNKASAKVLSLKGDSSDDGTYLEIRTDAGLSSQRFLIKEETSGLLYEGHDAMLEPGRLTQWRDQVITFDEIPVKSVGDENFTPMASSSSGLEVSYYSSDTSVAEVVNGTEIKIKSAGVSYITAYQDGDTATNGALPVTQLLEIVDNSEDLLLYYRFEKNTLDASAGGTLDAALVNGAKYVNGKKNYAISLNGTDQYLSLEDTMLVGKAESTIMTWLKLGGTSGVESVFDFASEGGAGMSLHYDYDTDSLKFSIAKGTSVQTLALKKNLKSNWVHVSVSYNGDSVKLYLDGQELAQEKVEGAFSLSELSNNVIARNRSNEDFLNGALDDFKIYGKALDAQEIDAMINGKIPVISSSDSLFTATRTSVYFTVGASFNPTNYEAIGLPSGLSLNSKTGLIMGKALNAGTYPVTIKASNYYGTGEQTLIITVELADNGGLIAHYPFDNSADDISGFDYNASLINGPVYSSGKVDKALSFDGSDDHVLLPTGIMNGLKDFTICTWVYLENSPTWSRIFDFGSGTDTYMFLTPNSGDGTLRFAFKNGGSEQQVNVSQPLTTGSWIHVAVTLASSTGRIYVDGSLKSANSSITIDPEDLGETNRNYIGRSQWPDPYLDGKIDDFRIYNRALSLTEIKDIIDGNSSGLEQAQAFSPLHLYPNPVKDILNIDSRGISQGYYKIFNLQGVSLKSGQLSGNMTVVNLHDFSSGFYVVKVFDEEIAKTKIIIKS